MNGVPAEDNAICDRAPGDPAIPAAVARSGAWIELETFLPYRLNVLASLVSQSLSRVYSRRYGIGVPEWRVLVTLGQFGVMAGKAIGAHSHMHKTKVSRAVAILERRKLVGRRSNPSDMREVLFSLTSSGRAMYDEVAPIALRFAERLQDALTAEDAAALERIIANLTRRSQDLAAEMAAQETEIEHHPRKRGQGDGA